MLGGEERERVVTSQMIRSSPSSDKKDVKTNIKCHSTSTSRKIVAFKSLVLSQFKWRDCFVLTHIRKIIKDYTMTMVSIIHQNGEDYYEDNFDKYDCLIWLYYHTWDITWEGKSNDDSDDNDIMTMTDLGGRG